MKALFILGKELLKSYKLNSFIDQFNAKLV